MLEDDSKGVVYYGEIFRFKIFLVNDVVPLRKDSLDVGKDSDHDVV